MDARKFEETKDLTMQDFQNIVNKIADLTEYRASPLFKHHKSKDEITKILLNMWFNGELAVYRDTTTHKLAGVLSCSITELWWIEGDVLIENLLVSLESAPNGFGAFAIDIMEEIAYRNNCVLICSGSSMIQDSTLIQNMYKKHGFTVYGESYLKEVEQH